MSVYVFVVCSGEILSLQSCECAGCVLHAICRPPYRLYEEQPPYCKVTQHCASHSYGTHKSFMEIMLLPHELCLCD